MSDLKEYSRKPSESGGGARSVPAGLAIGVAFGGVLATVGWCVFAGTMIFWWVFGAQSDLMSSFKFDDKTPVTSGKVMQVSETNASVGGSDDSEGTPVYQYMFEYDVGTGMNKLDMCYSTGRRFEVGQEVQVQYIVGNPYEARIVGTRRATFGSEVVFVAIFPLIGLLLVGIGYTMGLRTLSVLRRGKLASGKLIDKQRTSTVINNQPVYALTFEFTDANGNVRQAVIKTHLTGKVEDNPEELLFYDPENPANARMIDLLPGGIKVGRDGTIESAGMSGALLRALLLPALALGVHALVAWWMYG